MTPCVYEQRYMEPQLFNNLYMPEWEIILILDAQGESL